jgi:hypothetical protein
MPSPGTRLSLHALVATEREFLLGTGLKARNLPIWLAGLWPLARRAGPLAVGGGTMIGEAVFGGYTVPGRVEIGNMFETPDWAPFFRARVTAIDWG